MFRNRVQDAKTRVGFLQDPDAGQTALCVLVQYVVDLLLDALLNLDKQSSLAIIPMPWRFYIHIDHLILSCHDFFAPLKSLACRFRVMLGSFTRSPSKDLFILT